MHRSLSVRVKASISLSPPCDTLEIMNVIFSSILVTTRGRSWRSFLYAIFTTANCISGLTKLYNEDVIVR